MSDGAIYELWPVECTACGVATRAHQDKDDAKRVWNTRRAYAKGCEPSGPW